MVASVTKEEFGVVGCMWLSRLFGRWLVRFGLVYRSLPFGSFQGNVGIVYMY